MSRPGSRVRTIYSRARMSCRDPLSALPAPSYRSIRTNPPRIESDRTPECQLLDIVRVADRPGGWNGLQADVEVDRAVALERVDFPRFG